MNKRIKIIVSFLLISILISLSATSVFAATVERPTVTAAGAIVYCENTGEIIYSKNKNAKHDPYSITKILTALLAVQNLPLDKEVTISKKAANQKESSMGLIEGEVVTIEDLLYGALLPSGNDAAYALGEAVSGDMDTFIKLMNKTATNIGCENTHFSNPSGLESSKHYTSAYDMMQIVKVAFSNEVVKKIAGTTKYTMAATNKSKERILKTHISSYLNDENLGIYAGKTGYWDIYNATIALGYEKNGLNLYIVLLGDSKDARKADVESLIKYATLKVEGSQVVAKNTAEGKVRIKHGAKTSLQTYTAEVGYAYLPKEASKAIISSKVVMNSDVKAPIKTGDVVGKFQIYVADDLVNEVDLIVKEDVETGWFPSYLGISNMMSLIILAIILVIFIFFLSIVIMKAKYKRKKKKLRKQRIMEIAMEELRREEEQRERDWHF